LDQTLDALPDHDPEVQILITALLGQLEDLALKNPPLKPVKNKGHILQNGLDELGIFSELTRSPDDHVDLGQKEERRGEHDGLAEHVLEFVGLDLSEESGLALPHFRLKKAVNISDNHRLGVGENRVPRQPLKSVFFGILVGLSLFFHHLVEQLQLDEKKVVKQKGVASQPAKQEFLVQLEPEKVKYRGLHIRSLVSFVVFLLAFRIRRPRLRRAR